AVTVVHQDVDLARVLAERGDARRPLAELGLRVVVAEALGDADALLVPGLGPPAVEPDYRKRRRHGGNGWDRGAEALRHVDADVGEPVLLEELQRARLPLRVAHPPLVAKLDRARDTGKR